MTAHRLLVVEDDPEMSHLVCSVLAGEGRTIDHVETGGEALAALEGGDVDLIVLDLILPDLDGRTILARLRNQGSTSSLPVAVISARGGPEVRHDCYELGVDLFLEKPFDPEELVAAVDGCLERRARSQGSTESDPLTGLKNRAALGATKLPAGYGYAIAIIRVDRLIGMSDRWGWTATEEVLVAVARALEPVLQDRGVLGRIGGADFAFLLSFEARIDPNEVAQEALAAIRDVQVTGPDGEPLRLTASIGLVSAEFGDDRARALERARGRVLRAREAGGNQVVAVDPDLTSHAPRVLVAEDDEISATILTHRLTKEGVDVAHYIDGREAFEAALERTPDLVILDVKMPGMDGFEVLARLREEPAFERKPIILLTSMGSEADVVRGFQLGADDYILKPFSPVELSARVWRLLRRGRGDVDHL